MSDQEQERLKQLRERQLQSRDPLVKQRNFQHSTSVKEKRMRKPFTLTGAWKDIPHIIKYPLYGFVLGGIIALILPYFWNSPYTIPVSAGVIVILMVFGMVIGNAIDLREEIKNQIK